MADSAMDVRARLSLETAQFDGPLKESTHLADASANAVASANQRSAKVVAAAAKLAGDSVSEQSMRIIRSYDAQKIAQKDLATLTALSGKTEQSEADVTVLRAAAYQRLTEAKLATAAASKIEAAATEATILTQRSAVSAVVRASEGQQGIRAVEGFMTMIPGLGAAMQAIFPLVGGAMFVELLVKMGTEMYAFEQKAVHAAEATRSAFADLHDKAQMNIDDLRIENDKLDEQIAKLGGHPGDGLALTLDEARKNADKLLESLQADRKELEALLKDNSVGLMAGIISGQPSSGKQESEMLADEKALTATLRKATTDYEQALLGDKTPEAIKVASDARNAAVAAAYASQIATYRKESVRLKQEQDETAKAIAQDPSGALGGPTKPVDNSKRITNIEGRIGQLTDKATVESLTESIDAKKIITDAPKPGHAGADHAAEQRLKAMEAELASEKLQFGMSVKAVYDYWDARRNAFAQGSEQYNQILEKQATLAEQGSRTATEKIRRFTEQQTRGHEVAPNVADAMLKWNQQTARTGQDKSDTANELYAIQQKTAMQLEEMSVRNQAGRSLTHEAAALEMAAIHTREYGAELQRLEEAKKAYATNALLTNNPEEQQKKIEELTKRIAELQGGRQVQIAQDTYAVKDADNSAVRGATEALQEFTLSATNATKAWLSGSINTTNNAILKMLTEPASETRGQHVFGQAGHEIFTNAAGSLLKGAEGTLLSGLGLGGKKDGSSENAALWVRMAAAGGKGGAAAGLPKILGMDKWGGAGIDTSGLPGPLADIMQGFQSPQVSKAITGGSNSSSGVMGFLSKMLGGGASSGGDGAGSGVGSILGSVVGSMLGFAGGGDYGGDAPFLTSEKGTELVIPNGAKGSVVSHDKLASMGGGGDTNHTWNIDARGSNDPAAVRAQVMQGLMEVAPHIVAAAAQVGPNRQQRRPTSVR